MSPSTVYGASAVKRERRTDTNLAAVDAAIIAATKDEHPVSVRGVFYRVESAGVVPKTGNGYRLVQRQLLKLRRAGVIPYGWITDGTRLIQKSDSYDSMNAMLKDVSESYRRTLWRSQNVEVMVFTEKDAISGILYPVTDAWDVPLGVLRGYSSETFVYSVAEEVAAAGRAGKDVYLYQFGDHDPSGVNAWASFSAKVDAFVCAKLGRSNAHYERLAVTPEQIVDFKLPTRPTKTTDTRARNFEGESVEVDAVPAGILRRLVDDAITKHIDEDALRLTRVAEDSEREILTRLACGFSFVDEGEEA